MKILIGLGNPGKEYEHTYHNAGRLALEAIIKDIGEKSLPPTALKAYKNLFTYARWGDTAFVMPLTYMNDSGKAVGAALKKFNATPKDLIVIHDDSDITIGNIKYSVGRNSGGHNGVQSIIDVLGTKAFVRVRIGIRPKREVNRKKAGEFALKPITKPDHAILVEVFQRALAELKKNYGL